MKDERLIKQLINVVPDWSSSLQELLGLLPILGRRAGRAGYLRQYREDRPTYRTNHADAAMRSLG